MNIVIIEDEKPAADDLAENLRSLRNDIQITAILSSVAEVKSFFSLPQENIDLIFSDIQLGDGMSFDAFAHISLPAPVIFCTAYDEYALEAFRANGIGYILKPFSRDAIDKALQRFESIRRPAPTPDLSKLLESLAPKKSSGIIIHYRDKIIPLLPDQIALLHMKDESGNVFCFDQKSYPLHQPLDQIETQLGSQFFRVSRQYLVNRKAIVSATRYFGRKLAIDLSVNYPETVLVSKEKTQAFLLWLTTT